MSAFTPSRIGQSNLSGSVTALFLTKFAGEVLTAFETAVVLKSLTRMRVIENGKSASFPLTWKANTSYHTPGAEIDGQAIAHAEKIIAIDDLCIAPVFVADVDEAMNHFEVRSIYTNEMGRALALNYDKNICRNILLAARGAAQITGQSTTAGAFMQDADGLTNAASLADSIIAAKQTLDEKDNPVDSGQVKAIVKPAQWYLLTKETNVVMNANVNVSAGDYSKGSLPLIGGVQVYKSNAFPFGTNDSANTNIPSAYRANWTNVVAAVFTEAAAGTVQLRGLSLENERSVRHQGTLMVGKYLVGHGPLRHSAAVEIGTGAVAG